MALRSLRDIQQAHAQGRTHQQRFYKTTSTTGDGSWIDWSYAGGQPPYDARIGVAGAFNPFIASRNDAVFFPPIPDGMERQLAGVTVRPKASNAGQTGLSFEVYDLLGVYPLVDGDSTDAQEFDNALPLPRYADGVGVRAVIVNHVAPMVAAANATVTYTDDTGASQTVDWRIALTGQNRVAYAAGPGSSVGGPLCCNMASGSLGVRSIDSITFATTPGGLFSIYLIKPLLSFSHFHDPLSAVDTGGNKVAVQKCNCTHNAMHLPRIYDGANLGMFFMPTDTARNVDLFGHFDFIWG